MQMDGRIAFSTTNPPTTGCLSRLQISGLIFEIHGKPAAVEG